MIRRLAIDFDGTLVTPDLDWTPDAVLALRTLRRCGFRISVHSSRANSAAGTELIHDKLASVGFRDIKVYPKPDAFRYIDNKAIPYGGDWHEVLRELRRA